MSLQFNLQYADGDVRARVDEAHDPRVLIAERLVLGVQRRVAERARGGDAQDLGEGEVRTVGAGLIPALDGGGDRVEDDGEIEHARLAPLVGDLLAEHTALVVVELGERVGIARVLRHQCALLKELDFGGQAKFLRELFDILEELRLGDADEGVLDPDVVRR